MPVPEQTPVNSSVGNGVTTVFPYEFKILVEEDLVVEFDGVVVSDSLYSVSDVGVDGGGNVTFSTAPEDGVIVTRYRNMAIERQDIDYQEGGGFEAETVDEDMDRAVMLEQERALAIKRAPKAPRSVSTDQVITEEEWADRAGCVWGFDATGQLVLLPGQAGTSLVDLAAGIGASLIGYTPSGSGTSRTVQAKLREIETTPQDHSADPTGVASCVTAFQAAMTALANGGKFRIPEGTYLFTLASDSDSIQIPSNVSVECDAGVVFKYSYNDGPLFVIAEKSNVRFVGKPKFIFTGTFNTGGASGTTRFGYARSGGNYEWRCHIACVGSSNVEIDILCEGETTSNVQDRAILLLGADDGNLVSGNRVKLKADDVCQGIAFEGQKDFIVEVSQDRYSNASSAVYGPGHVAYHTLTAGVTDSTGGTVIVKDLAGTAISSYTTAANSASMRGLTNSRVTVDSQRAEGAVIIDKNTNVGYSIRHRSASTEDDTNTGIVHAVDINGASADVVIDLDIQALGQRNQTVVNLNGVGTASNNLRMKVRGTIARNCDGTESTAGLGWSGNYGSSNIEYLNLGSGAQRALVTNIKGDDNTHRIRSLGAVANPRITVTAGSNNTFICSGDSTIDFDGNEFTPASGNAVIWESARQYQSNKSIGVTTNPTTTIQLPKDGAYLVSLTLIESALDHARSSLWWVVWDNDTNDFTTTEEIVTAATKGGSAPSAMALAVDNAGLLTMTSTAGSATWSLRYGYKQMSGI